MLICKSENSLEPPSSPRAVCPAHAQFPGQSTSRKLNQSPRRNEFTYFFDLDWLPPRGRGVTFRPWHSGGVSWARQGSTWPGGNAPLVLVNFIRPWILGGWLPLNKDGGPPSVQNPILSNRKEGEGRGEKGDNEKKALIRRSSRGDFRLEIDLAATFENILDQRWDQVWCRLSTWVFENDSRCREENILE